jgi:hypothetical protein
MEHSVHFLEREELGSDSNDLAFGTKAEEVAEIYQYEPLEDDGSIRLLII